MFRCSIKKRTKLSLHCSRKNINNYYHHRNDLTNLSRKDTQNPYYKKIVDYSCAILTLKRPTEKFGYNGQCNFDMRVSSREKNTGSPLAYQKGHQVESCLCEEGLFTTPISWHGADESIFRASGFKRTIKSWQKLLTNERHRNSKARRPHNLANGKGKITKGIVIFF